MMRAEMRWVEANDIGDWPRWSSSGPADEFQWFTVGVGRAGETGEDNFEVAVATVLGLRERRRKGQFIGLVVERFEPQRIESAIREFVEQHEAHSWHDIIERLRTKMKWEYEGYHG